MKTLARPALLAALAAAAVLPSCGSDPITIGPGSRAALTVTVDPNPVVATQNTIGSSSASYKITITETNGLGGEFVFVNGSIYDPKTGALVSLNYYDTADMQVFVGNKRIEAGGSLSFTQTASYTLADLSKAATLIVSVQVKDDKTNLVQASTLVPIQ
jgi:hypothetical protein